MKSAICSVLWGVLFGLMVLVVILRFPHVYMQPIEARVFDGTCKHMLTVEQGTEEKKDCAIVSFIGSHEVYPVAGDEEFDQPPTWTEIDAASREYASGK